jgi:hypothetical protein
MDRQIILLLRIEDSERSPGGNDLCLGGTLVAHRPYDGSMHDGIQLEVEQAFARMLRRELQQGASDWQEARPDYKEQP